MKMKSTKYNHAVQKRALNQIKIPHIVWIAIGRISLKEGYLHLLFFDQCHIDTGHSALSFSNIEQIMPET